MIKQLPAFPAPPLFYADDVAQDIVAQFAFRNNSLQNEAAPLKSMVLSGATISEGQLRTTALANTYQFHCPYFGAGDFTVECKITFTQWGSNAGHYILCQHAAGDKVTVRNSWMLRASNTGTNKFFQWIENRMGVTSYNTAESAPFFVQLNKEYHVVVERFAGVTRIFVDGFLYGQFASAEPLVESPDNVFSESWDLTGFGRCLRKIRDIRIAKRAMYKGKVPKPSIRKFKPVPSVEFLGEVPADSFINGRQLAKAIGLSAGTEQNTSEPWLKFYDPKDKKTKYVAKKPLRSGVSWNNINSAGAVFGEKTVEVHGKVYAVRLLKGAAYDGANVTHNSYDDAGTHGSEWNRLLYRISKNQFASTSNTLASEGITTGDLADYLESDLGTHYSHMNGTDCWCQETIGSNKLCRGSYGVSFAFLMTADTNRVSYGWRPVLELIGDADPFEETFSVFSEHGTLNPNLTNYGATVLQDGSLSIASGNYLTLPNPTELAVGNGDFEIEVEFVIRSYLAGSGAGSSTYMSTFMYWGTWAAPNQPLNFEFTFGQHPVSPQYVMFAADVSVSASIAFSPVLGTKYNIKFVRSKGIMFMYVDGVLKGSAPYLNEVKNDVNKPLYIGRRFGGGSGEVAWPSDMIISKLRFAKR